MMMKKYLFLFSLAVFIFACNKDDVITDENRPPRIILDSESGIYTVKIGKIITISPDYEYVDNALFAWRINGRLASTDSELNFEAEETGDFYISLRVDTEYGSAEEELKIEVKELTPPVISIALPSQGLKVLRSTDYVITPDIQHSDLDGFSIRWIKDGQTVGTDVSYTFNEQELGEYHISIEASNVDGKCQYDFDITVVDQMPYVVKFFPLCYAADSTTRYTYQGRSVSLRPHIEYFDNPVYRWYINGEEVETATGRTFLFTPADPGEYEISVRVTENLDNSAAVVSRNVIRGTTELQAKVKVVCVSGTQSDKLRPQTASSSAFWEKVYDFTPAPGQFINETSEGGGFTGNERTMEQAIAYATERMKDKKYVSLGSFGGYIVVGFDHSIKKNGGDEYDFAIQGNAFGSSNEPGVVWVMQDVNGNGLPDDEWYELRGSETGNPETTQDYEVTYFRGADNSGMTRWIDMNGRTGRIDHNPYHTQPQYYPNWIDADSYTLCGTELNARNTQDGTGYWSNNPYEWGYADNIGSDNLAGADGYTGSGQRNGFKISNAMYPDGSPVTLDYIDFIKVQCGILTQSGPLGEISTEVFSFQDL